MNLRTIFISSFLSLSSLGVLAQERINLSGTWQFAFAANQKEADRLERFYTSDFAKSKFKSTPVPSNWALLGYEEPVYRGFKDNQAGEGFYVREFTIPQDWKDKRILLHFGGVWSSAEVWLNGNELGRHDCGYTSFAFDVTNKLKVDEPNKLAVRVRQITREYKFDVCDDWTWGGIYRDVTLEAMPAKRWIDDVLVFTFLVRLMGVSGPSMIPTLQDGDRLLVVNSLLCGDYQVGDIVIARKETFDSKPIVKRVIATTGQTVDIDFNLGQVYVDGELLDEDYINDYTYREEGTVFPLTVPEGEVFLMGDNRNHSNDSRDSSLGTVDTRLLIGKAVFLVFPGRDYLTEQREFGRICLLQ